MPPMLDNLIYEKRVPPILAVLIAPGPGGQRTIEYDTVSDRYTNFIETEVLPASRGITKWRSQRIPRAARTFGMSSGAAAALTMAWLHPNLYHRVVSYSAPLSHSSATSRLRTAHGTSTRPSFRILSASRCACGSTSVRTTSGRLPVEQMRNWVIANNRMAKY